MPGLALYDFGDMVRSGTNSAAEDEPDLSKVHCQERSSGRWWMGTGVGPRLPHSCRERVLAFSGRLISFEIGIRFLTDTCRATSISRPAAGQNLDRCRTQFKLSSPSAGSRTR